LREKKESDVFQKVSLRPAFAPDELQKLCDAEWDGIQLPLKLRVFLLTPGCFILDFKPLEDSSVIALDPGEFIYTNHNWESSFEGLNEKDVEKWLWLQGIDEPHTKAEEVVQDIKRGWETNEDCYGGCPGPFFCLLQNSLVYYNMVDGKVYQGTEMETTIYAISDDLTDWLQSFDEYYYY